MNIESTSEIRVKKQKNNIRDDQRGVVAIAVTLVFMIILTLVVLAFSQNSRRDQRQALDTQLSTQAFYAAESGVNDAIKGIRTSDAAYAPIRKTECDTTTGPLSNEANAVISYSCVLYDKAPPSIEYGSVDQTQGKFISLQTEANNLVNLTVRWKASGAGSTFSGCQVAGDEYKFKQSSAIANCDAGMVRLMFIQIPTQKISRDDLINKSYTVLLKPSNFSGAMSNQATYTSYETNLNQQGKVVWGDCTSGECEAHINNFPQDVGMFVQIRSIYKDNKVSLIPDDGAGNKANFSEAQIKVDATGRANDVLKRIQVRAAKYEQVNYPVYAVQAINGICKRLEVYPQPAGGYPAGYSPDSACGIN